jgi:putative AlgH/UPF0301 family transcriptional regulator
VYSKLISPCKCKGSSLLIHKHCLEKWQQTSFDNHAPIKALICQICGSRYVYPSISVLTYRLGIYVLSLFFSAYIKVIKKVLFTLLWEPFKLLIHAILVSITLPWGQFSLGDITLAWIGNEFPPQLALVCSGEPVPNLSEGVILVASPSIPKASIFHNAVVLLLEYSVDYGARGVILNYEIASNNTSAANNFAGNPVSNTSSDHHVGYGGPVDKNNITVIHDCRDLSNESDFSCTSENVFVTEYDSARRTLSQLSSKARTLITLYRVAAHRARQKFQECKSVATAYANRAKDSITASLRSAYSSTRRVVYRVSRGRIRLLPLLANSLTNRLMVETSNLTDARDENHRHLCENCGVDMTISPRAAMLLRMTNPIPSTSVCTECSAKESVNRSNSSSPTPLTHLTISNDSDENPTTEDESESSPTTRTNIRVLKGFSRWGPCQLDGEIRRDLWKVVPLRHDFIFPARRDESWWQRLNEEVGLFHGTSRKEDISTGCASTSASAASENLLEVDDSRIHSFFDEFTLSAGEILAAISN